MATWTIFDYVDASGTNEIRVWMDGQPKMAQVRMDAIIGYLQITPVWPGQYISALKTCNDIYELKIKSGGVQYRPLGFYGPQQREFTLLMGAIEKGGILIPRDFCTIATRLRGIVNGNRNHIVPHRFG
jgi:hypothetical protein